MMNISERKFEDTRICMRHHSLASCTRSSNSTTAVDDSSRGQHQPAGTFAHLIQLGVVRDAVGVDPVVPRRPRRRVDVQPARSVCDYAVVGLRVVVVLDEVIPEGRACHVVNASDAGMRDKGDGGEG